MPARSPREPKRCSWAKSGGPEELQYHDREWGVPVHNDRVLFEYLILEGAQAGLSWSTILRKRAGYRRAFARFDIKKIARFDARTVKRLMKDPGIVRNRLKIESTMRNARAALALVREFGSLDRYLWQFVGGRPIQHTGRRGGSAPDKTKESDAMSKALRTAGFSFVGSTICYAFMQAVGMVNDHAPDCFRRAEVRKLASA